MPIILQYNPNNGQGILKFDSKISQIPSPNILLPEEYENTPTEFLVVQNNQVSINQTKQRLQEIEQEIIDADELYEQQSQIAHQFEDANYKFAWTTLYQGILSLNETIFPIKIWDMSQLEENAKMMTKEKLQQLNSFLLQIQEPAFQQRKNTISSLLEEKQQLISTIE